MNGNKWEGKPPQNKSRKNLQLLVKNCILGGLNLLKLEGPELERLHLL